MSLKVDIKAVLDDSQAKAQQAELEKKNEEIKKATEENEKLTREAFNKAMGAMRAGYMVISGMTQAIGGSMSQAFSAIYGIALAGIGTYQAIAAAMAASGVGAVQAILMTASLITALIQLGAVAVGQEELAQQVGGLNQMVQGIGGMIGVIGY